MKRGSVDDFARTASRRDGRDFPPPRRVRMHFSAGQIVVEMAANTHTRFIAPTYISGRMVFPGRIEKVSFRWLYVASTAGTIETIAHTGTGEFEVRTQEHRTEHTQEVVTSHPATTLAEEAPVADSAPDTSSSRP